MKHKESVRNDHCQIHFRNESANQVQVNLKKSAIFLCETVIIDDDDDEIETSRQPDGKSIFSSPTIASRNSRNSSGPGSRPLLFNGDKSSEAIIVSDTEDCHTTPTLSFSNEALGKDPPAVIQHCILRSHLVHDLLSAFNVDLCNSSLLPLSKDPDSSTKAQQIQDTDSIPMNIAHEQAESKLHFRNGGDSTVLNTEQAASLEAGLVAATCLATYLNELQAGQTARSIAVPASAESVLRSLDEISCQDPAKEDDAESGTSEHQYRLLGIEHLLQLDPGWGLSSIVWHSVDPLERSRRFEQIFKTSTILESEK
jgi:hypothetical protein